MTLPIPKKQLSAGIKQHRQIKLEEMGPIFHKTEKKTQKELSGYSQMEFNVYFYARILQRITPIYTNIKYTMLILFAYLFLAVGFSVSVNGFSFLPDESHLSILFIGDTKSQAAYGVLHLACSVFPTVFVLQMVSYFKSKKEVKKQFEAFVVTQK